MEELSVVEVVMLSLRIFNILMSAVGILVGLDVLFGAKILNSVGKVLDKEFTTDPNFVKKISAFNNTLNKNFSLEKVLSNIKGRIVFGLLLILFAGVLYNISK